MTNDGLLFSDPAQPGEEDWDGIAAEAPVDENALYLELDGWEGPLDLLLDLARRQKVDLRSISILSLVDQYLDYIDQAEALKLELAAEPEMVPRSLHVGGIKRMLVRAVK